MAQAEAERERTEGVTDLTGPGGAQIEYEGDVIGDEDQTRSGGTLVPGTRQPGMEGTGPIDDEGIFEVEGQGEVQTNDTKIVGKGSESPSTVIGATPMDERVRNVVDVNNPAVRRQLATNTAEVVDFEQAAGPTRVVRTNTDLEDVQVGLSFRSSFEAGRAYRVPGFVADHLEEKGLLYH